MTILDQILADTRDLVLRRKTEVPVAALEMREAFSAPTLSLAAALRRTDPKQPPAIIAEISSKTPGARMNSPDLTALRRAGSGIWWSFQ